MAATFNQEVAAGGTPSNSATLVLTLSGITTTVGNHLILCIASRGSTVINSIVDSKGNTWQVDKVQTGTGAGVFIASCKLTVALVNADTITITFASSSGQSASVAEYSGLHATTWFDVAAAAIGTTGTAADSGATATTAQAGELLVGMVGHQSTVSGFTPEVLSPIWNLNATAASVSTVQTTRPMYRVVAATGTYSAKATWTTSRVWGAAIAAYIPAPATGYPHSMVVG